MFPDRSSELQIAVDGIRNKAIIGLGYVLEVQALSFGDPTYHCVLCEKPYDGIVRVVNHLTSLEHRLKYLVSLSCFLYPP